MIMQGTLFCYDSVHRLVGFETDITAKHVLIFIGGLTDGLLSSLYLRDLQVELASNGYSLIQLIMRSSYQQYGMYTLDDDVEDMNSLLCYLIHERKMKDIKELVLLGHSTGCQDIIHYLKHGKYASYIHKAILQAPASDRDYYYSRPGHQCENYLSHALQLIQKNRNMDVMPSECYPLPITAQRYHDLHAIKSKEDMFSYDLDKDYLSTLFRCIDIPILLVFSGKDEYVPSHIDLCQLAMNLQMAIKNSQVLLLPLANHAIDDQADQRKFINALIQFIIVNL